MKLEPECIGCLFNQILRSIKLLKPEISRERIIETQKKLMEYLIKSDIIQISSPIAGKVVYGLVSEILGERDPFKSLKMKYNNITLSHYDEVKKIVSNAKDPLFEAIIIAALGNTIDFGSQHEIKLIEDIKQFSPENLAINDYEAFQKSLEISDHLLILLDNAGEIVFDKIFIETLQESYPRLEVVCSVRAAPIINDATIEDAKFIGLTEIVRVIEASPAPGIDLTDVNEEFKAHFFKRGGIILSKGQGNFESLYQREMPNKEVYYLLKAKCSLMERIFGVNLGELIFKKKTNGF